MTYDVLMQQMRAGNYPPVIVVHGEEPYYIDQVSGYVEQNALDEMAREFDQVVLYGKDLPGADISPAIAQVRSFPMMGDKKVVIVKEAQHVKKWEALAMYMQNQSPSSLLVICYKYGKVDGRSSLWKNIEKQGGALVLSEGLRDYQVPRWIENYIAQKNNELRDKGDEVRIDPKVTQILATNLGTDLTKIVGALQKLVDGRPEGVHVIDAALVERNVGISKDFNVFELQEALVKGDVVKANRITQYFASSKDHPMVKELGILYGFFQNLMLYHYYPVKSDEKGIAAALKINPYFVKDYAAAAKRYPAGKVFRIMGYFREIDARSKGVNNPSAKDGDLWKELIYQIMH